MQQAQQKGSVRMVPSPGECRSWRIWLFRGAAVMLGILPFLCCEFLLALFGLGSTDDHEDPFVGFSSVHPLFTLSEDGLSYEIPKSRRDFFAAESFAASKPTGTFRVFCLGGSTVQGRPYSKGTSFTTFLELGLNVADERRTWEAINCGGVSYASYRLVPILSECLQYEPDLFVICTGHNEFLEDRTYGYLRTLPTFVRKMHHSVSRLRTYVVLRQGLQQLSGQTDPSEIGTRPGQPDRTKPDPPSPGTVLPSEVEAILDYHEGLKAYHRDPNWQAGVIVHYEYNIRRMVSMARDAGVPVVLVRPPSNLRDCPPFKSEHRDGMTAAELERWNAFLAKARARDGDEFAVAIPLLLEAIKLDEQYAKVWNELGRAYLAAGQSGAARDALLAAREHDICPLRMLQPLEAALHCVATDENVPLVDLHAILEADSPDNILGDNFLVDHIHPSFEGHMRAADAILEAMAAQGWVDAKPGWREAARAVYDSKLDALPATYFLRGRRRLNSLHAWTQGRADGPPVESRYPQRMRAETEHTE